MNKLKIITVVGTRPELIRLSRVLDKLDKYFEHVLVHTGQNFDYELNQIFLDELDIRKPDYFLDSATDSNSPSETIGKILINVDKVFSKEEPDAMLVLGDTNSCLSVIPAKRRKIPIFHMEAGNRCFDMRVPEEINRRIVDHTSDINLTYSKISRDFLLREGLSPDMVIKIGSPMQEVLTHYSRKINKSNILKSLKIIEDNYFVVSSHREENIDNAKNFMKLVEMINALASGYNKHVILSVHPRTRDQIEKNKVFFHEKVKMLKPLGFFDYNKLQIHASAVLSDSGTITEESSILNFPALNIRETHERHEGMEEATVMMTGLDIERISQGLDILKNQTKGNERVIYKVDDYNVSNVSEKVIRIIQSYTDYVNRVVWKKY